MEAVQKEGWPVFVEYRDPEGKFIVVYDQNRRLYTAIGKGEYQWEIERIDFDTMEAAKEHAEIVVDEIESGDEEIEEQIIESDQDVERRKIGPFNVAFYSSKNWDNREVTINHGHGENLFLRYDEWLDLIDALHTYGQQKGILPR